MREYKFRGFDSNIDLWRYGSLRMIKGFIAPFSLDYLISFYDEQGHYCEYYVKPETVGQYTGVDSTEGSKIYEGDIIKVEGESIGQVYFFSGNYCIDYINDDHNDNESYSTVGNMDCLNVEIIGNIHQNLKLLEIKKSD